MISRRRRQSGKPDRRTYENTVRGHEALGEWLATPLPRPADRDPFLLQLYFGAEDTDDALLGVLRSRRDEHRRRIDELRDRSDAVAADRTLSPRASTLRHTALDGVVARELASVEWLDDCIRAIEEGALPGSDDGTTGQRHLFGT